MPQPRVTVVISTYQRADLVCRALRSVFAQTCQPDEVIVVDDGSTDGTSTRLASEFPRARVLRQENRGVSAARNRGIAAARGRWIALLDSDDEWQPSKLERQFEALRARPHAVCHCDEIWFRDGRRVNPGKRHSKRGGSIYLDCLPLCAISPSAVLLERRVFSEVGLFDESLPVCEDYDMWLRVAARFPVLLVNEALVVKHGGHGDQLSRSRWGMDRFRVRALAAAWRELNLDAEERRATLEVLLQKLEILLSGARKRQRDDLLRQLGPQLTHFRHLMRLEELSS